MSDKYHKIAFRSPSSGKLIYITIPSLSSCTKVNTSKPVYCGNKRKIPKEYIRKGTSYECLKKGIGTGRCLIYK